MIAQWENECISLSVLSVAWVQFSAMTKYFNGIFFPGRTHSASRIGRGLWDSRIAQWVEHYGIVG